MASSTNRTSGFSRRDFLKGSGAVAATTSLGSTLAEVHAQEAGTQIVRGETTITLNVNGTDHTVQVEPRTTLLEVLRYQLNLTGAKPVSDDGSSGASTVLQDGKPVSAETVLALAARGKRIETVESLPTDGAQSVPAAFVEHDAQQCGFCTPGFVVAVSAFLREHPQATLDEIRQGLNGNICRCGTYADILEAVTALVKGGGNG